MPIPEQTRAVDDTDRHARATGLIRYRLTEDGPTYTWRVTCHPTKDTADTLREHLERWKEHALFVSAEVSSV